ncbi:MAG: dipeptide ABC transporter ATP-binding protein [Leucobacter sp.]
MKLEQDMCLSIRDLRVSFDTVIGEVEAVQGISFDVRRGRTVALVGESGSGKSVSAMAVVGLLPKNAKRSGTAEFMDQGNLLNATEPELRSIRGQRIGVIFQEPMTALNPAYTIGQQLRQAITSHSRADAAVVYERSLELLQQVQMPEPEHKLTQYPHQLSGGQRQRAMIAMALSGEPDLLIADEPTTALDVTVQAGILDLLRSLQESRGISILIITHDMGVVADIAHEVVVMKSGEIVESAPAETLFANPTHPYTRELLDTVPHLGQGSAQTAFSTGVIDVHEAAPLIEFEGLEVSFARGFRVPRLKAVDSLDLAIADGEIVALVGESGSGKSTIGRLAAGLIKPTKGTIRFGGKETTARKPGEISMIFQDPGSSLNPRVAIGDSIVAPMKYAGSKLSKAELRDRAAELLEQVRLPGDWIDRYPHQLSGGQRQRVGIARAIATRPRLLIADEPTSALDASVQRTVLELFAELQRTLKFSCLFITHDLPSIEAMTDRTVVLKRGKVVESGPTQEILADSKDSYTRALIASVPIPDPVKQRERRAQLAEIRVQ